MYWTCSNLNYCNIFYLTYWSLVTSPFQLSNSSFIFILDLYAHILIAYSVLEYSLKGPIPTQGSGVISIVQDTSWSALGANGVLGHWLQLACCANLLPCALVFQIESWGLGFNAKGHVCGGMSPRWRVVEDKSRWLGFGSWLLAESPEGSNTGEEFY